MTIMSFIPVLLSSTVKTVSDMSYFILCTMLSEAIPIIMMFWLPDFPIFHFTVERQKHKVRIFFFVPGT